MLFSWTEAETQIKLRCFTIYLFLTYKVLHGTSSVYIYSLITLYTPTHLLNSLFLFQQTSLILTLLTLGVKHFLSLLHDYRMQIWNSPELEFPTHSCIKRIVAIDLHGIFCPIMDFNDYQSPTFFKISLFI